MPNKVTKLDCRAQEKINLDAEIQRMIESFRNINMMCGESRCFCFLQLDKYILKQTCSSLEQNVTVETINTSLRLGKSVMT